MSFLIHEFLIHLFVGLGFGVGAVVFFIHRGWTRVIFRFGGEPMSLGHAHAWVGWYLFALVFEIVSSMLMGPSIYRELALSMYEAVALTCGLFVADRAGGMIEFHRPVSRPNPPEEKPS